MVDYLNSYRAHQPFHITMTVLKRRDPTRKLLDQSDSTQPTQRPYKKPEDDTCILYFWKWEILNLFLAIAMLGGIYGVLQHYEDRRVPDWGPSINLTTLTAILATVLRVSLGFVIAEIIGQAKWSYFTGDRPTTGYGPIRRLIKTEHFDLASRGLFGSIRLLPTILTDIATLLAVLVMIGLLGIGPLVQQAIQTRTCQFPLDGISSRLTISRNITAGQPGNGNSIWGPLDGPSLQATLAYSFAPSEDDQGVLPMAIYCPTGNCTFSNSIGGIYSTLGMCSYCINTTSFISSINWTATVWSQAYSKNGSVWNVDPRLYSMTNYTLPNGMTIQAQFGDSSNTTELVVTASRNDLDWASSRVTPKMRALSQWAFANVTIFTPNWDPKSGGFADYISVTCTLYPCLRSYTGSVTNGMLNESLISTMPVVPNVIGSFPQNATTEDIYNTDSLDFNAMIWGTSGGTRFQAIQSPCLVDDTVWTDTNMSSVTDKDRLLLLQADPTKGRNFFIENTAAPRGCIYDMDIVAWSDFSSFLIDTTFNGTCSAYSYSSGRKKLDCHDEFWLAKLYSDDGITVSGVVEIVEAFTDRLSNKLRMGLINNPSEVLGQVWSTTVCTTTDRRWLLFPTVHIAVTAGLLSWSVMRTWRHRGHELLWKSSVLPFLLYGERFVVQNDEDVSASSIDSSPAEGRPLNLRQMESEAKQREVRFRRFRERDSGNN
ncbi:hypothetical protein F5B20DRAFT_23841 [Whalleya microplaca]|nr:hypothetical protein F5B20DRAFT_23841 [Whalleya microplaca]